AGAAIAALLVGGGVITAIPLFLFAYAARALPYSTTGVMQYITPTLQLLSGVALYHESFGPARAAGFALLWVALLIYATDEVWRGRRAPRAARPPPPLAPPRCGRRGGTGRPHRPS